MRFFSFTCFRDAKPCFAVTFLDSFQKTLRGIVFIRGGLNFYFDLSVNRYYIAKKIADLIFSSNVSVDIFCLE